MYLSNNFRVKDRTQIRFSSSRIAGTLLLGVFLASAPALWGQSTSAPQSPDGEPYLRRFSFGGRLSFLTNKLINNEAFFRSTSEPPVQTELFTESTPRRFGGGATVQFVILDKVALGVDVLYRSASYESSVDTLEGVDDPDTSEDDRALTTTFEQTSAVFWDVPILARIYNIGRYQRGPRFFFDGGVAIRHIGKIRTSSEFIGPDGLTSTDQTPVTPANTTIMGIVVGGGFQLMDDFGLKVMPEVRFTRWVNRTFETLPTLSSKNQLEVVLGITW
jgi:hypothetical protein